MICDSYFLLSCCCCWWWHLVFCFCLYMCARVCLCVCTWRPEVNIGIFLSCSPLWVSETESLTPPGAHLNSLAGQWAPESQPLQCWGYRHTFPGAGRSLLPSMHRLLLTNNISPATNLAFSMWAIILHASLRFAYIQKHLHSNEASLAPTSFFFFKYLMFHSTWPVSDSSH